MALLFQTDRRSYAEPLERAIAASAMAVLEAGSEVVGSQARAQQALADHQDLRRYIDQKLAHLEQETFYKLPHPLHGGRLMDHVHVLTVGPWKGFFLLDPQGEIVIGLLFSKAPHRLLDRLGELVLPHSARDEDR